ncbi:MAG: hypothetical protein ACRYG5_14375 [Janthinobacterium lividum]
MDELSRDANLPAADTVFAQRARRALATHEPLPYLEKSLLGLGSFLVDFVPLLGPAKGGVRAALADDAAGVGWNTAMLGIDLVLFGTPALARALQAGKVLSGGVAALPPAYQMILRGALRMADMFESVRDSYAAEHAAAPPRLAPEMYRLDRIGTSANTEAELDAIAARQTAAPAAEHLLVRLHGDDRLVRIERRESHFREVDMVTGAPVISADPIYLDPVDATYYSRPELPVDPFLPPLIAGSAAFRQRITIRQLQPFLDARANYDRTAAGYALARMFVLNMDSALQMRVAEHMVQTLEKSWDFVRLLNFAKRRGETWKIVVEDTPLGPHTSFPAKQIVLVPLERISSLPRYMSPRGATPATFEQILDHELMHALTGEFDPDRTIHGLTHRGGVSYLASRIAFDRGDTALPRVMYPHPSPPHISRQLSPHENPLKLFVRASDEAAMGDRLLDHHLVGGRPRVLGNEIVFGQEVNARPAVTGFDSIDSIMRRYTVHEIDPARTTNRAHYFEFGGSVAERRTVEALFPSIIDHDALSSVSASWEESLRLINRRWSLTWRAAERSGDAAPQTLFKIDRDAFDITFYGNEIRYLSEIGIRPVEPPRQLLLGLLALFLPTLEADDRIVAAGKGAYQTRSSLTLLADDLLFHLGYRYPRQIARRLADATDDATCHRLAEGLSDVRRAADKEDDYLSQRWVSPLCIRGTGCGCTILRR